MLLAPYFCKSVHNRDVTLENENNAFFFNKMAKNLLLFMFKQLQLQVTRAQQFITTIY